MATSQRPTAADFHAFQRGGGLFTTTVNQRIGSFLCVPAHRFNVAPTTLTLGNLLIGLTASALVGEFAVEHGGIAAKIAALTGLVLWQLAYSLDCADGQLARFTGRTSSAGARLDILCDVAVQSSLVVAVCNAAWTYSPGIPRALPPAFCAALLINLYVSTSASSGRDAGSLFANNCRWFVRLASLTVDYGMLTATLAATLAFAPTRLEDTMGIFMITNFGLLAVRIAVAARRSMAQT